jgi:mRNA interferase YafQ
VRTVSRTNRFKKDYKRAVKRGKDFGKLFEVVERLAGGEKLEARFHDHSLGGEYEDCRECHIAPDWLLIYRMTEKELVLIRTGSHSNLFE